MLAATLADLMKRCRRDIPRENKKSTNEALLAVWKKRSDIREELDIKNDVCRKIELLLEKLSVGKDDRAATLKGCIVAFEKNDDLAVFKVVSRNVEVFLGRDGPLGFDGDGLVPIESAERLGKEALAQLTVFLNNKLVESPAVSVEEEVEQKSRTASGSSQGGSAYSAEGSPGRSFCTYTNS